MKVTVALSAGEVWLSLFSLCSPGPRPCTPTRPWRLPSPRPRIQLEERRTAPSPAPAQRHQLAASETGRGGGGPGHGLSSVTPVHSMSPFFWASLGRYRYSISHPLAALSPSTHFLLTWTPTHPNFHTLSGPSTVPNRTEPQPQQPAALRCCVSSSLCPRPGSPKQVQVLE